MRVSRHREESISIESQKDTLTQYCNDNGYNIIETYIDDGVSGCGKAVKKRRAYLNMLDDAQKGMFDFVAVWRITRLGRNLLEMLNACYILEENNIELISYCEDYDFTTASGKFLRNIIGAVAEFEEDEYSENIKMVFNAKAKRGGRMCHFVLGYDLDGKDAFKINQDEKERVLRCFELYQIHKTFLKTSQELKKEGVLSKTGKPISPFSLAVILRQAMYCGYVIHHGILLPSNGNVPQIIDISVYNKVQILMLKNSKSNSNMRDKLFVILDGEQVYLKNLTTQEIESIYNSI